MKRILSDSKELLPENLSYLEPKETIKISGKLSYKEGLGSWNVIQLQKEIIDIFPQLREKRGSFGYTMFYNRSSKESKKIMEELEKRGVVPIFLLLGKVKEN
ncbi:MAG: hypothetical protein AABX10_00565 [Nanoarchaeota archaeon]